MITWKLTIELILETFDITQQELANLLGIGQSTLSRIKNNNNGKRCTPPTPDEVYQNVFNPNGKNNPAEETEIGLLNTLKIVIEQPKYREIREGMDDLWNKTDYQKFVKTLIQRTRYAPKPQTKRANVPNSKTRSEQLQELFLNAVHMYKIMEIINREPAVLNKDDSVCLNNFLRGVDTILPTSNSCDGLLLMSIESFRNALEIQAISLEATLNNRFYYWGENISVHMEEDDMDSVEGRIITERLGLPEFSLELVQYAKPKYRLDLIRSGTSEWGNFRNEMNSLFERIRSWSEKTAE